MPIFFLELIPEHKQQISRSKEYRVHLHAINLEGPQIQVSLQMLIMSV